MECAAFDQRFLDAVSLSSELTAALPAEAQVIVSQTCNATSNIYLDTLSRLSIHPVFCSTILACYEPLFPELVARWRTFASTAQIAAGLGRVLPVVPYLVEVAECLLLSTDGQRFLPAALGLGSVSSGEEACALPHTAALEALLALNRLLCFKRDTFLPLVDTTTLYHLLKHTHSAVRYVAIRILCIYLKAADDAQEEVLEKYGVGRRSGAVLGPWEGRDVDYGFLMSLEGGRFKDMSDALEMLRAGPTIPNAAISRIIDLSELSPMTVDLCGILTPRLRGAPKSRAGIVDTPTTRANVHSLALALRSSQPILVTGHPGSGKTFLIHHIAHTLNALDSMVSIHLSGQTDAKLLIGTYTTADATGSFEWRPGVLATAVREGRWVLVEDIDKAPTDVLSVLLPLIERSELDIPSRGDRIKAARGFRLITTARTSPSAHSSDLPTVNILGSRLWLRVNVQIPAEEELQAIVNSRFPPLQAISSPILTTYTAIQKLYREPSFFAISRTSLGRQISPRDLFKWCSRINALFVSAGVKEGATVLADGLFDEIFNEAVDCFAGSLHTLEARRLVAGRIAEELHVPSQRVELLMQGHIPSVKNSERTLVVGRAKLQKRKEPTCLKRRKTSLGTEKRPFATTNHALRLLEQVGVAVRLAEPVLLVGETGTGKTTVVQQLADMLGFNLTAINLSQQTEAGDLLGGYKPVDVRTLAVPLKESFDELFEKTFSLKKNKRFMDVLNKCWRKQQWKRIIILWGEAVKMAENFFATQAPAPVESTEPEQQKKKRKLDGMDKPALRAWWTVFARDLSNLERQSSQLSKSFTFSFVEGSLVKAARNGDWVLLDEINLAASDTLESIADLLKDGGGGSILLSEKGDVERIQAHPNFRIFACMNPATDVGKRDLPSGLRSRFTELYVASPDTDLGNLLAIVKEYIGHIAIGDEMVVSDVALLYLEAKKLAEGHQLVDGANQKPHFSMRTLTRTLSYVTEIVSVYGLRRSLYEGFCMSFLTLLDRTSEMLLLPAIDKFILAGQKNVRSLINQIPRQPADGQQYVQFKHYWMHKGPHEPEEQPHYIITPFVERNMLNLVRATATRKFPVLIQGPTSSGKTSMIEYLAKRTGHRFVRINNHEHTDLQEYLGSYVSDNDGKLHFLEGILVDALRKGHWIVLDELNLAPTDVLEALNRLLDDNRELLIPETQESVRPHKDFMLFATQNPPGLYGGRKNLSRAFRNRFLELHFDDIPESELGTILKERCQIAPSYGDKIVKVYKELSLLRQSSRIFEQKNSFATLRDLFRWANRDANGYQQLAEDGYMLLAERVRKDEEKLVVQQVLEKEMRVKIDANALYAAERTPEYALYTENVADGEVVWTKAMKRLFSLIAHALRNNEPVLLVGETGCGKTTVCQMLAEALRKRLFIVNAHQNMETGDIIGAQRPIRNRSACQSQLAEDLLAVLQLHIEEERLRDIEWSDCAALVKLYLALSPEVKETISAEAKDRIELNRTRVKALFEWAEGPLIQGMKEGQFFLLDEISLADDSVLERLNSVLEPARGILLAEKGPEESQITASDGFQFLATMNPGGDYGKKELSPALRNRFTEIWVPSMTDSDDVLQIVRSKLKHGLVEYAEPIVRYAQWFSQTYNFSSGAPISIRDVLAWTKFVNLHAERGPAFALLHGAALVFFDGLGANPSSLLMTNADSLVTEKQRCITKLSELVGQDLLLVYDAAVLATADHLSLRLGSFILERKEGSAADVSFSLEAPTTAMNAMRVVRAMQLRKPILLEGSPGVGKTSLITALAAASGNSLTRINLSDQTDLMDLFGSDVPVEGGKSGEFAWRDAPFLRAMQNGNWVLLDEMNLASQSVLEGLNACLDHRGEVYISELDRTFSCHPDFAVFAAQNPHHQGGGRKGLPASFVNRFTVVYVDQLTFHDLQLIARKLFPTIPQDLVNKLIDFVTRLDQQLARKRSFGAVGGPWQFNLRDTLRWLELLASPAGLLAFRNPQDFIEMVAKQRFRTVEDKKRVDQIFADVFGHAPAKRHLYHQLSKGTFQVGNALLPRRKVLQPTSVEGLAILKSQLPVLETVITCVQQNTPVILVGASGTGKSSAIKLLAAIAGAELEQLTLNADIDTTDIVGGFEQVDISRKVSALFGEVRRFLRMGVVNAVKRGDALGVPILELVEFLGTALPPPTVENLHKAVAKLQKAAQITTEFEEFVSRAQGFVADSHKDTVARFEWVDGMLIKAMEEGRWLVLDNANLCSPSVLDRLNSLLETNGFLIVNEHSTANGDPKLAKPHPEFRLFITMDPKHGELSRAMRNRCVEVFIDQTPEINDVAMLDDAQRRALAGFLGSTGVDADVSVFQLMEQVARAPAGQEAYPILVQAALEHVPRGMTPLLNRWKSRIGEWPKEGQATLDAVDILMHLAAHPAVQRVTAELVESASAKLQLGEEFMDAQPLVPIRNSSLFPADAGTIVAALFYDVARDILATECTEEGILQKSTTVKLAEMNFLERSASRRGKKMPAFGGSVGVQLFEFLTSIRKILEQWLEHDACELELKKFLRVHEVLDLWRDLVQLSSTSNLNESVFHVYLSLFEEWIRSAENDLPGQYVKSLETALQAFREPLQLVTGQSMEVMWIAVRPSVPRSLVAWEQYLALNAIMARFDKVGVEGNLDTVLKLRESLVGAAAAVLTENMDVSELVKELDASISQLEESRTTDQGQKPGVFNALFDLLLKFKMIRCPTGCVELSQDNFRMAHFANRSTESLIGYGLPGMPVVTSFEQVLGDLWSYPTTEKDARGPAGLLTGKLAAEMLRTNHTVKELDISRLQDLEVEIKELSKQFTLHTDDIIGDRVQQLNVLVLAKVKQLIVIHKASYDAASYAAAIQSFEENATDGLRVFKEVLPTTKVGYLRDVISEHLIPMINVLLEIPSSFSARITALGTAWVHYALACIKLYVPNVAFDPAMKPMVERLRHLSRKSEISARITAEKLFELKFTGQEDSNSIQMLQRRFDDLGEEPPNSIIARPVESKMSSLQGDLSNVLRVVVDGQPHKRLLESILKRAENFDAQQQTFQTNLSQLVERLGMAYPVYKDMVDPVIGFIYYLKLGLSLAAIVPNASDDAASAAAAAFLTPYETSPERPHTAEREVQILWLRQHAARSATEGYDSLSQTVHEDIHDIFQRLFKKWKDETIEEGEKAIANNSLYTYRGEAEDQDEQEFMQMFSVYEEDEEGNVPIAPMEDEKDLKTKDHKGVAIRIASLHAAFFSQTTESLSDLVRDGAAVWAKALGDNKSAFPQSKIKEFLPAIFLSLKDTTEWISGIGKDTRCYDFYNHENLEEAHKLVSIVKKVHKRMSYLLDLWPENVTLQDAVDTCQQLFEFHAKTPVAKFLTKVEKLHGILNEWQGVASREFTAQEHYDTLTQLIIAWRRLELTTWPRLFDLEDEKAKQNAYSWWFFLYESIIANPLQLLAADMKNHILDLVASLVNFVGTSSVGQFLYRLQLLGVFEEHVGRMSGDFEEMKMVHRALQSFMVYYQQYECSVAETLKKDRKKMEKAVADVVLLASWKDTNIIALRDSAKRSHHKLYKVVRKYRQALDAPVFNILAGGMSSENGPTDKGSMQLMGISTAIDETRIRELYTSSIKPWTARPPRLRDLGGAMGMMQRVSALPSTKLDVAGFLECFSTSIITTTKDLQAETPAIMTEDVKKAVAHLKTRKRKAFTDALKELRQMGLKSNLSRAQLSKQASLERILAAAAPLQGRGDVGGIQHYFVRILETVMKVRSVKETSADLQGNDVARVMGFMEHLLSVNLEQRATLSSALGDLENTRTAIIKFEALSDIAPADVTLYGTASVTPGKFADAKRKLQWLPKILAFTADLVRIRAEFAGAAVVEGGILTWTRRAQEVGARLEKEKVVHSGIWTAAAKTAVDECDTFFSEIRAGIHELVAHSPEVEYAFNPLMRWVSPLSTIMGGETEDTGSVQDLDTSLQALCDSIFVSLQKLNEAHTSYPTEATEAGWLLTHQTSSAASIKALHMRNITYKVNTVIELASRCLKDSIAVRAAFAAYWPVVAEYQRTCERTLQEVGKGQRATAKTTYILATTALTILTKGFCAPAKQGDQGGESKGALEAGTGLGDGEGAEDISKDIKEDEDLSELAQEKNNERQEEIEAQEDAVDMGEQDMEGQIGDKEQKLEVEEMEEEDEEGERNEGIEEETGDVDDLDPTAVDEKMWDEKANENDREKEGDTSKGKQQKRKELEAKKEDKKQQKGDDTGQQGDEDEDEEEEGGAEQDDDVKQQNKEGMDEHVPEVDTLELPEDMQLDGDESEDEKDDELNVDVLSDAGDDKQPEKEDGKNDVMDEDEEGKFPELTTPEVEPATGMPEGEEGEDEEIGEEQGDGIEEDPENPEEPQPENEEDNLLTVPIKENAKEENDTAPSDLQGVQGGTDNQDKANQASAQQESGEETKSDEPQQGHGTEQNESRQQNQEVGAASAQDKDPTQEPQAPKEKPSEEEKTFQKVGDILEKWHKQRKQILNASDEDKERPQIDNMELDDPEFEHLPTDETEADTQALGTATEEQAHGLDDSMAIDSGVKEPQEAIQDDTEVENPHEPAEPIEHASEEQDAPDEGDSGRVGAVIGDRKDGPIRERQIQAGDEMDIDDALSDTMVDDEDPTDAAIAVAVPLKMRSREEARTLWQRHESATRTLSAGLCEQLRLILEPTQATKMRGDFRTGKRLNMRRIIPYIASAYKKDKIWMRRAKPSKRQYQVILAVDDSRSMAEGDGSTANLALQTVALVARALSALEVGQIAVMSFGETASVVHPFDIPFTAESGVNAFERFTFSQQKTDVRRLLESSLSLFSSTTASSNEELWQLQIVISDGVCEEHEALRRIVRKAHERRVMIVFVVVDSLRENSILELNRVAFVDGEVTTERYLDKFPFGYYLVVRDVRELPGVLAGALRQWFSESVE